MTQDSRHLRMASADSALRARLADLPFPAPADAAFMQRLLSIPEQAPGAWRAGLLERLAAALAEAGERYGAPRLLAGEAAALAGALALGLWLGAMTATGVADSLDLSAYLLAGLDGPLDVGGGTQ